MKDSDTTYLELETEIVKVLKNIYDPEIPVNIYELGLIYEIKVKDSKVDIKMTLTAPNCPVADSLVVDVREEIAKIPGVKKVNLELTFDPPWGIHMMTDEAKLMMGML